MKKVTRIFLITLIGLLCAGSLWAHGNKGRGPGWGTGANGRVSPAPAETVTVNGNLQLVDGHIAVVSGGTTYFVNNLQRLVGFIDGLKEGAAVKLEGSAAAVPLNANARFLRVTRLTINGKTYDFPNTAGWGRY
ncbi:hypothetical protein FACS1894140_6840 [Spirochaetia bacterium]|nr:hypothetical protein FACS1894140_6840 [Spirochaetia bacterium]